MVKKNGMNENHLKAKSEVTQHYGQVDKGTERCRYMNHIYRRIALGVANNPFSSKFSWNIKKYGDKSLGIDLLSIQWSNQGWRWGGPNWIRQNLEDHPLIVDWDPFLSAFQRMLLREWC